MAHSIAQSLPVDILLLICRFATDDHPALFAHGGKLPGSRWDSYEAVHPLTLVCKRWHVPATKVLYQSIAVLGGDQARLLLRTLDRRPGLGQQVRRLVIGLDDPDDDAQVEHSSDREPEWSSAGSGGGGGAPQTEASAREDSFALAQVLIRCTHLSHLQIRRALHHDTRDLVLPCLQQREYDTLICAPRFVEGEACIWTEHFHQPRDVLHLVRPCVRFFEFEFSFPPLEGHTHEEQVLLEASGGGGELGGRLDNLRGLRLDGNVPPSALERILARVTKLDVLDVYTESTINVDQVFSRVTDPGAAALRRLRFLVNPRSDPSPPPSAPSNLNPPTSFLTHLTRLDTAVLFSTELSCSSFLRRIPPSLKTLEILCFAHDFPFHPAILAALNDWRLVLGLVQWKVSDAREAWTVEQVRDVGEACEARGIRFTWEPGLAESDSSGFGSGSGSGDGSAGSGSDRRVSV